MITKIFPKAKYFEKLSCISNFSNPYSPLLILAMIENMF